MTRSLIGPVMARHQTIAALTLALILSLYGSIPIHAQQHRATRLGNPATRFAPPRVTPEDLRALFADPNLRPDIESILQQSHWQGDPRDLYRAAESADITEVSFAKGSVFPHMSSRENGRPVALEDVLWAGNDPVEAFVFTFVSKGRLCRCTTPKPCSNFYVEDIGPEPPKPTLELTRAAPAEASLCDPIAVNALVRNNGICRLTRVHFTDVLPPGVKTTDGQATLEIDLGDLEPGAGKQIAYSVHATDPGPLECTCLATAAEAPRAQASSTTLVRAPVLEIECAAPAMVPIGRPAEICLTVRNAGDAPEPQATASFQIPAGTTVGTLTDGGRAAAGSVLWELGTLEPGATRRLCAALTTTTPGTWTVVAEARGACAKPRKSQRTLRTVGVGGLLLEVVDLEDPIEVGQPVTYTITVKNQGSADLTNLRLRCAPHGSQQFISASGRTPIRTQDASLLSEVLDRLEPKAEVTWQIVVKAQSAADARFKVELTADQYPTPVVEYEATEQY